MKSKKKNIKVECFYCTKNYMVKSFLNLNKVRVKLKVNCLFMYFN